MRSPFDSRDCSASVVVIALFLTAIVSPIEAHEPTQTHRRLTIAALELLKANSHYDFLLMDGLEPIEVELELALGAMEEDRCVGVDDFGIDWGRNAFFSNHFYEPATQSNEIAESGDFVNATACKNFSPFFKQTARDRAAGLYALAMEKYRDGEKRAAFRVLGRVAHILEDMTSPAHIHNDPHGHLDLVGGDRSIGDCSFDIDDFETWGFCQRPSGKTNHILDYFRYQSETGDTSNLTDSRFINSFGR